MSDYVYHFDDTALKRFDENFETRVGDNSGYHEQDFFDSLDMLMAMHRNGACLDVGAGMGRISAIARDVVAEVVALEPDESRWQECHREYHREPDCLVLCQTTRDYIRENPGKQFDLVIVSAVVQHMSTTNCDQLMRDVSELLKDDGQAIIFTTHTLEKCKGFSFTGDNSRAFVPQDEFNAYTDAPPVEQSAGLPVRRFSKQDLLTTAEQAGLECIYWRQTSYYRPDRVAFFSKRLEVERDELMGVGNSQFIIAQKKPQENK